MMEGDLSLHKHLVSSGARDNQDQHSHFNGNTDQKQTNSAKQALFGNLTAVFSLLFDNLVNLVSLQFIFASSSAPSNSISSHLYVGSLLGVIVGNLSIYYLTTRKHIPLTTSIPFGIDAPTVFFIAYAVFDIYVNKINSGVSPSQALMETWGDGAAIVLVIGLVKFGLSVTYYFYDFPKKINKQAFAGCLAGIGIALLGMNNLTGIFDEPLSGLVSLFVLLMVTLPDPRPNDWRNYLPHFLWSVLLGVPIYYILVSLPLESGAVSPTFFYSVPQGNFMFSYRFDSEAQKYLVQSVSYAFLVWSSGYSVIKVALEDDLIENGTVTTPEEEKVIILKVLFLDAICTIITSLFGGLIQTTPYIGYNTYKKLHANVDYSWIFAFLLLALSVTGSISYLADALPEPVLKPIFVLIALHIAQFAFGFQKQSTNKETKEFNRNIPAIIMALFPAIAQLMLINGNNTTSIILISSGFVITSILWAQVTMSIIQEDRNKTCLFFLALSVLTFFGLIHSFDGDVYYDIWNHGSPLPVYVCVAYAFCAVLAYFFVPSDPHPNLNFNDDMDSSSRDNSLHGDTSSSLLERGRAKEVKNPIN